MSHQKPRGDSGQAADSNPDKRPEGERPRPHGDKLAHAVKEASDAPAEKTKRE